MIPINSRWMTQNDCYKSGRRLTSVKYLIVHSTATPGVMAADWFSRWNKPGIAKCVHAFIDDTSIWQYLPWPWRAWQIGTDWGNSNSIGIEMCEDKGWSEEYFRRAIRNMIDMYAVLAKENNVPVENIIGHYEAYQLGIGSNHGDPRHWWSKFGYTMDDFRNDVRKEIDNTMIYYKKGMTGDGVKTLQSNLNKLGYSLVADGIFGSGTEAAVKDFQGKYGLVVDGIAGAATLAKIEALLTTPAPIPTPDPEVIEKIVEVLPAVIAGKTCTILIDGISFAEAVELLKKYPNAKINL